MTTSTLDKPPAVPTDRPADAVTQARRQGAPVLVSTTVEVDRRDLLAFFAEAPAGDRFFWRSPDAELTLVGIGVAREFASSTHGPAHFAEIADAWRGMLASAQISAPEGAGPMLMGGFAFDPDRPTTPAWDGFPPGLMVLPRILLAQTPERTLLTTNSVVGDDNLTPQPPSLQRKVENVVSALHVAEVSADEWKAAVAALAADIRAGAFEKAVLAREVVFTAESRIEPAAVLRRLSESYADCYIFAFCRGERCFLGATPERLVSVANGELRSDCLAGTARRGADAEEDARLGSALLASAKDRIEHALVARMLAEEMSAACTEVVMPDSPGLRRLRNLQHLYTPISGRLREGTGLLELVGRLHPTPAMGGTPREAALARIRDCERLDRGWYTGPVGRLDSRGEGEFAVAIRCALLEGSTARAYAGCGIVGGSDPDAEYTETEVKLRAVLSALEGATA